MRKEWFAVAENIRIARDVWRIRLSGDTDEITAPGQFVNVRTGGYYLRRPISVCDWDKGTLTLIYKVVGGGTEWLSERKSGEMLDVLTGLGNGFPIGACGDSPVLVGGGVGVAPICGAMDAFATAESRAFFGFRTAAHAYGMTQAPCAVIAVSDDGSLGERALVTKPLEQAILEKRPDLVMACGPAPMLAAVQALCEKYALPCQISLEERMGCGIGACLGCNVKIKTADGGWCYKRVCKDGPVFDAKEVCLNG